MVEPECKPRQSDLVPGSGQPHERGGLAVICQQERARSHGRRTETLADPRRMSKGPTSHYRVVTTAPERPYAFLWSSFQFDRNFRHSEPRGLWVGVGRGDSFWFCKFTVIGCRFQENGVSIQPMHFSR